VISIALIDYLARAYPQLRKKLRMANVRKTSHAFVKQALFISVYSGLAMAALFFFLFAKKLGPVQTLLLTPLIFFAVTAAFFMFRIQGLTVTAKKRQKEIDKQILFAGRYLLVKMESGTPMFNALTDISHSYGVGSEYFREIVNDIETGVTIEKALENTREYTPSYKFKKLLWQLIASLKTGTEVSSALRSILHSITIEQMDEIKAYGKKLNSLMMFYLVLAVVAPSLGVTLFLLIASFLNLDVSKGMLFAFLFFLAVVQLFFIGLVKSARPAVDI
jgi:pilus assembly protein TadC